MGNPLMRSRPQPISPDDTKTCPYCAETIKRAAVVCRFCGRDLIGAPQQAAAPTATGASATRAPAPPQTESTYTPPKRTGCGVIGGYLLIGLLVFGMLILVVAFASLDGSGGSSASRVRATPRPTLSVAQMKQHAISISYDALARNTESYVGKTVHFQGEVLQVIESSWDNSADLRVYMEDGDAVYVHYSGSRLLEGDQVDVYATVDGRLTYETVLGAQMTVPETTAISLVVMR